MKKQDFSIYKRKISSGKEIYYYTTYDEKGKRKYYSTGKTEYMDAFKLCLELLKKGTLVKDNSSVFKQFTKNFFDYDLCPYIQGKLARGYQYSRSHADKNRSILVNKLWPVFGETDMARISPKEIEDWLLEIKAEGYRNSSVNQYLSVLKLIFNEAERMGLVRDNPMSRIKPFKSDTKEKGIITDQEWQALFSMENRETYWEDEITFCFNYLASVTAMRIGEIQALRVCDIHSDHIVVEHSYDPKYGLTTTKTKKKRTIPIDRFVYELLTPHMKPAGFIFSCNGGKTPISRRKVCTALYRALSRCGIDRGERNITFHSWRHFKNTRMRMQGVPEGIVQAITGHASRQMMDHYSHYSLADLKAYA